MPAGKLLHLPFEALNESKGKKEKEVIAWKSAVC